MTNGKLAAYDLIGGVTQSIYQNNTDKYSVVSLSLCNRGTAATSLTVGIGDTESVINNFDIFEYEIALLPKNVLERTGIVVPSGKYLTVLSTKSSISAVATGVVTGVEINTDPIATQADTIAPLWLTPVSFSWPSIEVLDADHPGDATYTVTSGALPDGLSLNSTTGLISGTPTVLNVATTPTIRATTPGGQIADRTFTITPIATTAPVKIAAADQIGSGAAPEPAPDPIIIGEYVYSSPGSYTWTAPDFVTSVSVLTIGGGGGGAGDHDGAGGGGGGLGWKNEIAVIPGQDYTVVVGAGGLGGQGDSTNGNPGAVSYFINTSTVAGYGGDRGRGNFDGTATNGGSYTGDGGGRGGHNLSSSQGSHRTGGAGAGGYTGAGGDAPASYGNNGGNGSGGGGGAGAGGNNIEAAGGGGTGIYGQGSNGAGGNYTGSNPANPGYGGSGGQDGQRVSISGVGGRGDGGRYGGGGGGTYYGNGSVGGYRGGHGGHGVVRIVIGPDRSFPSTNVDLASSEGNVTTV